MAELAGVGPAEAVVDACQGIDLAAWGDAGWRVSLADRSPNRPVTRQLRHRQHGGDVTGR